MCSIARCLKPQCHPALANCPGLRRPGVILRSLRSACRVLSMNSTEAWPWCGPGLLTAVSWGTGSIGRDSSSPTRGPLHVTAGSALARRHQLLRFPTSSGFLSRDHNRACGEGTMSCPRLSSGASCREAGQLGLLAVTEAST